MGKIKSTGNYQKSIARFNKDKDYLGKAIFCRQSTMKVYDIHKSELAHSSFLYWIFDNEETQKYAFALLVKIWSKRAMSQGKCNINDREIDINKILKINVTKEEFVSCKNNQGRADLVIRANCGNDTYLVCIENKIRSKEHDQQTNLYYEHFNGDSSKYKLYIFLAPYAPLRLVCIDDLPEELKCSSKNFVYMCYQDILDMLIELLAKVKLKSSMVYIKDYINSITTPDTNTGMCLAVSREDKAKLKKFWNDNYVFIRQVAFMLQQAADGDDDQETLEMLETIINNTSRYTKYRFDKSGEKMSKSKIQETYLNKYFKGNENELQEKMQKYNDAIGRVSIKKSDRTENHWIHFEENKNYCFKQDIGGEHFEKLMTFIKNNPLEGMNEVTSIE